MKAEKLRRLFLDTPTGGDVFKVLEWETEEEKEKYAKEVAIKFYEYEWMNRRDLEKGWNHGIGHPNVYVEYVWEQFLKQK